LPAEEQWLRISAQVFSHGGHGAHLVTKLQQDGRVKQTACRMENAVTKPDQWNIIDYWFYIPADFSEGLLSVSIETNSPDIQTREVALKIYDNKLFEGR
jgi:hypothetical protein